MNISRRLVTPESSKKGVSVEPYSKHNVVITLVIHILVRAAAAPIIDPLSLSVILGVHEDSLCLQTVNYGKSIMTILENISYFDHHHASTSPQVPRQPGRI